MAFNLKLPKREKASTVKKSAIPTKNYINIQLRKKQSFDPRKNLPIIIIIAVLLVVFCKFMVIDRILDVTEGSNRVAELQQELNDTERQINEMADLEDQYAHYTTSGMTQEELSHVNRVEAMEMVNKAFKGGTKADSWNLTGNVMTLQVSGPSLSKLNNLAVDLERNAIVERCVISTADKGTNENGKVVVTFTVYLKGPQQNESGEE